ncbi:MAG TPA: TetR/AcrR family transcriptional regulator [Candidatus Sumerlaeota bacterium]|nr:TetR/AcrR family transcriptional regulator [Candidatus Sumerlaeota bacterium]
MSPRQSLRESILKAAEDVIACTGAAHMTLDAISAKAGVSRGGLLYHFPNKDALIMALLDRQIQQLEDARTQARAALPEGKSRDILALINSVRVINNQKERVFAALLGALAQSPGLVQKARARYKKRNEELISHEYPPVRAVVISLAIDGLWLMKTLGIVSCKKEFEVSLAEDLRYLADECLISGRKS